MKTLSIRTYLFVLLSGVTAIPALWLGADLAALSAEAERAWATAAASWLLALVLAGLIASHVGRRFSDSMAEHLSRHTHDLEGMVSARTAELAEVNEHLTTLVNALERAGDGIEITDPDARFLYVNPAFERLTGYSARELIGRTPAMLRCERYGSEFYDVIWQRITGGQVYCGEFVAKRKDGSLFDQELTVWPVLNERGEITHFVGLRRDVTERRRTEQALRVSERMASMGTLAAGVAHEINNPLTYVLLNLHFVQEQARKSGQRDRSGLERVRVAVDRAVEGADRVSAIVRELRKLSRPDDRSVRSIDPRAVLESALRMVKNDIRHRAELVQDLQPVPAVLGNDAELAQVFVNLLVNAVQALVPEAPRAAEIRITTGTDAHGCAVIEIADTGAGIPPEHLHRIFDPFFTTKPVGLGTGIGLSVCHSTVKSMNGEIQVESAPGVGTSFRVRLPGVAFGPDESRSSVQRKPRKISDRALRVLVLDDDHAVGEAIALALPGHEITLADGAEEGLAAVEQGAFDAILCDVMMPGVTGLEFYERLASASPAHLVRVIFITGGVLGEQAREFLEQRRVPWLEKPVSAEELEASLARLVAPENVNPSVHDVPRTDTG